MKQSKFKAIIYLISLAVVATLGIQVYRNLQNYQLNKQRLIADVQLSLDNAIEAYYARLAKQDDVLNVILMDSLSERNPSIVTNYNTTWVEAKPNSLRKHSFKQIKIDSAFNQFNITRPDSNDTGIKITFNSTTSIPDSVVGMIDPNLVSAIQVVPDSVVNGRNGLRTLANNLIISMSQEMKLDSLAGFVETELDKKGMNLDFGLQMFAFDYLVDSYNNPENPRFVMSTTPKSTYQFKARKLEMRFADASLAILQRGLTDLIISLVISAIIIGVLLYLYRVISQQKQLAEIKNDLISNITHEFKTPIATVSSAIEGIANFNQQNDPAKTKKYLDISSQQLGKLNVMVEKLLETATLETDALQLNKTPVNLNQVLHTLIEKYRLVNHGKEITFQDHAEDAIIEADAFHLENALSNLVDNAVKYGGDQILVSLAGDNQSVQVVVQDNGGFIEKSQKERVFDKFYRIPKGNQHDVKGFGIGLYYTRKIIEKHGGSIELILRPGHTSFEVAI